MPTPPIFKAGAFFQQRRLQVLRDVLRSVNVPDATADQVVDQQTNTDVFVGYVSSVSTYPNGGSVYLKGDWDNNPGHFLGLDFPPNDPNYLLEFQRAQSHPHLKIWVYLDFRGEFKIIEMAVISDYDQVKGYYTPPFDVREIKNTA